ncbi:phage tail tape measure protein [Neobacillus sp. MM2021_6]|uniref:phage tail tape measure protein n=1 Tax=Bacillaceae TaxID=186817 RepID=UPI001407A51C|nr:MULTISPECIES: phage tail tape measure protein [Bacillaceae]MBO0962025.1 phage tail tape measure protein [Neobacillus sp. MM2021_6]NHC20280.1 phage tail tape measure protein [Bacillus sp. MM2020_4]
MNIPGIVVKIGADISNLTSNLRTATAQVANFVREQERGFKALGDLGKIVTGFGVATAGGLGMAVKTAANFEFAMSRVAALSGATDKELKQLTATAEKLGRETSFTASQAAEGMQYLAMAGYKTNDVISAMPGLLAMAAAGQTELGETADIASNILSGFGLKASETARVADILTKTFTSSNTDLRMLGYTMKYVGPVAKASGQSLEMMAASAGILGNAGIQADSAGTALRMMLIRLAKPPRMAKDALKQLGITISDSQGNMKDLSVIIGELSEATKDMGEADRLAAIAKISGTEASAAMLALMDAGQGTIEKFTKELENSGGTAEKIAAKQLENLKGQLIILSSAIESAAISFGNALLPALKKITSGIQSFMNWFNGLSEATKSFIAISAALSAVFMLIVGPMLIMVGFLPSIISGFSSIALMLGMTSKALLRVTAISFGWISAILLIVSALVIAYNECEWFRNAVNAALSWIVKATKAVGEAIKIAFGVAVDWSIQKINQFKPAFSAIGSWFSEAFIGALSAISSFFSKLNEKFGIVEKIVDYVKSSFDTVGGIIATISPLLARLALGFLGVSGPIGWIIATVISLMATLFKLSKTNEDVRAAFESVWNGIKTVFTSVLSVVKPILDAFAKAFIELAPQFAETGRVIGESLVTLGPTFSQLGQAFSGLVVAIISLLPNFMEIGKAVVHVAVTVLPQLLSVAEQVFKGMLTIVSNVLPIIINLINTIVPIILAIVTNVLPMLLKIFVSVFQMIVSVIVAVMPVIIGLIQALVPVITAIVTTVLPLLLSIIQAVFPVILAIIQAVIPVVIAIIKVAADIITNVLVPAIAFILSIVQAVFPVIVSIIDAALKIVMGIIKVVTGIIKGDWSTVWSGIKSIFAGVWEAIKAIVIGAINLIKTIISGAWSLIKGLTETVWNAIKSLFSSVLSGIVSIVTSGFNAMVSIIGSISNTIKDVIQTAWNSAVSFLQSIDLVEIGKNILQGLIKGISSMTGAVRDAITGIGKKIKDGFTSFFQIHSPSRLMSNKAKFIPLGIIDGIKKMRGRIVAATARMSEWMTPDIPSVSMAYDTPSGSYASLNSAINGTVEVNQRDSALINMIVRLEKKLTNLKVEMDSREVGRIVEPTVTEQQEFNSNRMKKF